MQAGYINNFLLKPIKLISQRTYLNLQNQEEMKAKCTKQSLRLLSKLIHTEKKTKLLLSNLQRWFAENNIKLTSIKP